MNFNKTYENYLNETLGYDDDTEKDKKTPFKCKNCGYRHSDQVIQPTKASSRATWQQTGSVYCSYCGHPVEHVNLNKENK